MNIKNLVDNVYIIIIALVTSSLNKGIKQFFMSEFIMFTTFTLYNFQKNKNIILSMAIAFVTVILVTIITTERSTIREAFNIISPTSDTKIGCENITASDLVKVYGTEDALKKAMIESLVPHNLYLSDENAPEIATYLVNMSKIKISDTCFL